jgi:hypothetical protein
MMEEKRAELPGKNQANPPAKTKAKKKYNLPLLPGGVYVLLAVSVRVCHVPGLHV